MAAHLSERINSRARITRMRTRGALFCSHGSARQNISKRKQNQTSKQARAACRRAIFRI